VFSIVNGAPVNVQLSAHRVCRGAVGLRATGEGNPAENGGFSLRRAVTLAISPSGTDIVRQERGFVAVNIGRYYPCHVYG
jgi:hypothetical protein